MPQNNSRTIIPTYHIIGMIGCLGYVILFLTLGIITAYFGLDTLWVLPIISIYAIIWIGLVAYSVWKNQKKK